MLVVTNGTLITPNETIADGRVILQGDAILDAAPASQVPLPAGATVLDAERGLIGPGFIDLNVQGFMGRSVMKGEVTEIATLLPAYGVTSFLATMMPDSPANLLKAVTTTLDNARRARMTGNAPRRARVLGLHLLGPWLSPAQPGTLDPTQFRLFDLVEWQRLRSSADKFLRLVTLAPELVENTEAIETMRAAGACVSLGYSTASYEQTLAAAAAGASAPPAGRGPLGATGAPGAAGPAWLALTLSSRPILSSRRGGRTARGARGDPPPFRRPPRVSECRRVL